MEDLSVYRILRKKSQKWYKAIGKVFSPALGENVYFTAQGFNHIIFRHPRGRRTLSAQIARFNILAHAVKLVELSTTYQEFEVGSVKHITYWGIVAIMKERKLKVVLRKIGNGNIHFWSVFPQWITSRKRDEKFFQNNNRPKAPR